MEAARFATRERELYRIAAALLIAAIKAALVAYYFMDLREEADAV